MKVLHFITTMSSGGAERMLSKLATLDIENEHIIVTLFEADSHYDLENVKIINLNYHNTYINRIRCILSMRRIIKAENPDIIQTWLKLNYYGPLLKIFTNAKLSSNYRNGYTDNFNQLIIKALNIWNKAFDINIFVSKSALAEREENGYKFKNNIIINNGFTLQEYKPIFDNKDLVFGHIARFHKIKNQQIIIDSFNHMSDFKNVKLIMAGRELRGNLKNIKNSKIEFLGNLKNTNLFYKNIDVLILTSHSEGFPNVVGEAMSFGIPVIASDAGESHEIVSESGFKLIQNDTSELVSVMENIYSNRDILKHKSRLAKKIIKEKYDISVIVKQYQQVYLKL